MGVDQHERNLGGLILPHLSAIDRLQHLALMQGQNRARGEATAPESTRQWAGIRPGITAPLLQRQARV